MTHSPEPWTLETGWNFKDTPDPERWVTVSDANRQMVLYDCAKTDEGSEQILEVHQRIVACVNACAGLSTEALLLVAQGKASITTGRLGGHYITTWPITEPAQILSEAKFPQ